MAIYINTNQNVQINYEISSIGDRLIAYLIDSLVITGLTLSFVFIGMWLELGYLTLVAFVFIFFYHLICEITMNGQSIGKRNRKIRVMKKDGNAAGFSAYFLRFLLRPIDSIYGLGLAFVFFTNNNQRLGDLAAGTIIVNIKTEQELKTQIRSEMHIDVSEQIKYQESSTLDDKEIQIIRNILQNRVESKFHPNVRQLAEKVAEKIKINREGEQNHYEFLQQIVSDYYKIHTN